MNQEIWLMRHGYYSMDGSLTTDGVEQIKKSVVIFKEKIIAIYYSPVIRCVETAMILKNEVCKSEGYPTPWLGEGHPLPDNCLSFLKGDTIVVVSHQPILYKIAKQIKNDSDHLIFTCGLPIKVGF